MKLHELVTQYITYRKSLGEKFHTNETYLKSFVKILGQNREIQKISEDDVAIFLYKSKIDKITSAWFIKHTAVLGFYQYAFTRGFVDKIPLPKVLPKRPPPFVPYIYSKQELRQLLDATSCYQKNKSFIEPYMIRVILLLLYATGMRMCEALALKLIDIDLVQNIITVQHAKFYKSRLLPIGNQLSEVLKDYLFQRNKYHLTESDAPLFAGKDNLSLKAWTMQQIFQRIRDKAGISRSDKATYPPRLHDLRHTFAVHHLINWYQEQRYYETFTYIINLYGA